MTGPLSLAMMKMEKNFKAHVDKGYERKPWLEYPVFDKENPYMNLSWFVTREKEELDTAIELLKKAIATYYRTAIVDKSIISDAVLAAMWEVADVSNTLDYLFEGLSALYHPTIKES